MSIIGSGAMGRVWRGCQRDTGEAVAVKVLRTELSDQPEIVGRFVQELSILRRVDDPHVVRFRDLVVDMGALGLVMDLIPGPDLRKILDQNGPLRAPEAALLVAQVCRGLDAIHKVGIVHRDLKPENVLVDTSSAACPTAKITDFGIARLAHSHSTTRHSIILGTPEYIAPELIEGEEASPSSDLYSAGVVLYELLSGQTPFAEDSPVATLRRHLDATPLKPVGVPQSLWVTVASLLEKRPSARPQSSSQVAGVLEGFAGDTSLTAIKASATAVSASVPPLSNPKARDGETRVLAAIGRRGPALRRRQRPTWRAVLLIPAVVVSLAAAAWGASTRLFTPPDVGAAEQSVSMTFAPEQQSKLTIVRSWRLHGAMGKELDVVLQVSNGATSAQTTAIDEVIPKAVASSIAKLHFASQPSQIIQADPVVRFALDQLAPGTSEFFRYSVDVQASGLSRARLEAWAQAERDSESAYLGHAPNTLASLTITPPAVDLMVNQSVPLQLAGTMTDGSLAPAELLGTAQWSSNTQSVATTFQAVVRAIAPGQALVTATIGSRQAVVSVTVTVASPSNRPQGLPAATASTARPLPTTAATPNASTRLAGGLFDTYFAWENIGGWKATSMSAHCDGSYSTGPAAPCEGEFGTGDSSGGDAYAVYQPSGVPFELVAGQHYRAVVWIRCANSAGAPEVGSCSDTGTFHFEIGDDDCYNQKIDVSVDWHIYECALVTSTAYPPTTPLINLDFPSNAPYYDINSVQFFGPY